VEIHFTNQAQKQYFRIALIVTALIIKLTTLVQNVLLQPPTFTKVIITHAKLPVMVHILKPKQDHWKEFVCRARHICFLSTDKRPILTQEKMSASFA